MKRKLFLVAIIVALAAPAFSALPAHADGIIIPPWPPEPPPPGVITDPAWLTIKYHRVHIAIDNQIATTRVDQVFVNEGNMTAEGTYIFPLPEGATVDEFIMWVDGQPIEARILEKDEARRIYDDIVRRFRDPALLEYVGTQMVQANVFPIAPGEERRIELEYAQVLDVDQDLVTYRYPLNTERFSARPLEEVVISVEVNSNDDIGAIYSDTHDIAVNRDGPRRFTAGYEAYNILPDTDFILRYGLARDEINVNLLTYRESADGRGFFALLVAPPVAVDAARVVARDIIVVLDQSGSMDGEKWDQARTAAAYVLDNLNPEDRFNLVVFSTGWRVFANEMQPPREAGAAIDWINDLEAIGGTDINAALTEAMAFVGERPAVVIFLTDGLPTEGVTSSAEILANVKDAAPPNVRLFAFGVGDDVDTLLLDTLTREHQGASAYVRPGERIDEEVSSLYAKISAPVLSDIALDFGDVMVEEMYPAAPLPDLFAGTQMIVVGRYRDGGATTVTLTGKVGGDAHTFVYSGLDFRRNAGGEVFIPRLWATRRIGDLLQQIRLHGENPELVDSIVQLSLRYGIITPYTSFLITEDDIFTEEGREAAARELEDVEFGVSGAAAVDAAEQAQGLGGAEMPMAMPTQMALPDTDGRGESYYVETREVIRYVNAKTFVFRDGVWIDTEYDPDALTPEQVAFLSDAYFDLVAVHPELGDYFALGDHVIVVFAGVAYEVTPSA
ncbi:MAG: VIT domain-containing protein [Anaerolineae bacterium]|nr:VIT domain-containing protein [Anaerolineae bacterium]